MPNLVDYSDSEESDNAVMKPTPSETIQTPSTQRQRQNFQKFVSRAEPQRLDVGSTTPHDPSPAKDGTQKPTAREEPPAKRIRTDGAFSGFNSFLPQPKKTVGSTDSASRNGNEGPGVRKPSNVGMARGMSLKTGSTPAFSRDPAQETQLISSYKSNTDYGDNAAPAATKSPGETVEAEVKLVGSATIFKPLSVSRNSTKKKKPKATARATDGAKGPPHTEQRNGQKASKVDGEFPEAHEDNHPKTKSSLFSTSIDDLTDGPVAGGNGDYEPLLLADAHEPQQDLGSTEDESEPRPAPPQSVAAPHSMSLNHLANSLNLSASERRQLLGRNNTSSDAGVAQFSLAAEYSQNRELIENQSAVPSHNPVRSIAPGKHSLQQLVNAAASQKDALEESFASGKRTKKDAGSKYGW